LLMWLFWLLYCLCVSQTIKCVKTNLQQLIDVINFLLRRYEMRPTLHGIPRTFYYLNHPSAKLWDSVISK
jgi:hypothetical protein